jgi:cobalt-zinc-cadmium efflux system membrane fusion protein
MMTRLPLFIVALLVGMALASFVPGLSERIRIAFPFFELAAGTPKGDEPAIAERKPGAEATNDQQGVVKLSAEDIEAAGIEVAPAQSGTISHRIIVPSTIVPHADRIAHVAVKLSGNVAELRKKIGDPVATDEVLAILESREVADAKSEYLGARVTNELQQELFERDRILWDKKALAEQQLLRSRNAAANAKIRNDIARQKLFALGLNEKEIADLPNEPEASFRRQEIRSPIAGHVVERKVELGVAVGRDALETELFVVADLDRAWVELAVSPEDAPLVRNGQTVSVAARGITEKAEGKVIFISPMLDKDTHSARVVAEIDNKDGVWRPGFFVTAAIAFEEQSVPLAVPVGAIQTMDGGPVAFVRTAEGFQRRQVVLGQSDDRATEVVSGLHFGEAIAVTNTFLLKAEMLKGTAEE